MLKFAPNVWINDGTALTVRAISTPEQALAYLRAWRGDREASFEQAVKIVEAAVAEKGNVADARDVFRRFANSHGVLSESDPK